MNTPGKTELLTEELTEAMKAMNNMNLANYYIRLQDQSYVTLKERGNDKTGNQQYQDAQEMLNVMIELYVKQEYRKNFQEFVDLNTIAERLEHTNSINFEYQEERNGWCLANISGVWRENGKVTKIMLLISKLTKDSVESQELLQLQKEAVSLLANTELLFISVIHKKTGESHIIQSKRVLDTKKIYDFERSMKRESTHVLPSKRKAFLEDCRLDKILDELKKNDHYTVTTFLLMPNIEQCRRISYHFSNCRDEAYILSATEDTTEAYTTDCVTGMKNFEGFMLDYQYEIIQKRPEQFVVANFNIVNFKAVNSIYGYEAGNRLLGIVQEKLESSKLKFISVCRENADNFFCLCSKDNYDFAEMNRLCKMKIQDYFGRADTLELFCGIYPIVENEDSLRTICDKARLARKHAEKEIGVNSYVFDEDENAQYLDEAVIMSTVPKAIENEEFVVYYQPIYEAQTGRMISAEALVRWLHPEKGLISPGAFIPVVERTGQITEIDLFVGQHIQQFQSKRMEQGEPIVPISINMSRYDFLQEEHLRKALNMIRKNPEIAGAIRIEITESGLINFPSCGEFFIHEMRSLGIKTMIDDFGTGYSSLASVIDRPCDIIKLDMSFARRIGIETKIEDLIIGAINTAHRLGVSVVAEGVETKEQYEFLKRNKCDYIQGFYFSKPLPENEFEMILDKINYS